MTSVPEVSGATVAATANGAALIAVTHRGDPTGEPATRIVRALRELPLPADVHIGVTGAAADLVDQLDGLGARLPWMALLVIAVAFVVMFAACRSLVLPVKAILTNVVSLGAAFGVVVLVFQEGHLASWLG